jgi:hypothetical protein
MMEACDTVGEFLRVERTAWRCFAATKARNVTQGWVLHSNFLLPYANLLKTVQQLEDSGSEPKIFVLEQYRDQL